MAGQIGPEYAPEQDLKKITSLLSSNPIFRVTNDQLCFNFSIANEVVNIWLINKLFPVPKIAQLMIDPLHLAFAYAQDQRKTVSIGAYITDKDELSQIRQVVEFGAGDSISYIREVTTTLWSLMDMVYLRRQEVYYDALRLADKEININHNEGITPMSYLAIELTSHLLGNRPNAACYSPNDFTFYRLVTIINNMLSFYCSLAFETIKRTFNEQSKL